MDHKHHYVLIMAGGTGTRLYPRSRESFPKQYQKYIGDTTIFQQSVERAKQLVPVDNVYVVPNKRYVTIVGEQTPELPSQNIIAEPAKRNTAAAMIVGTAIISQKDPEALIVNSQSDNLILKPLVLLDVLEATVEVVDKNPDKIAIVGMTPPYAHTGYGYLEAGEEFIKTGKHQTFKMRRFVEKPDKETAESYLRQGNYYWNSGGIFVWKATEFLEIADRYVPEIVAGAKKIAEAWGSSEQEDIMAKEFEKFTDIAIEPAVLEKLDNLLVVPIGDFGWSDVGAWETVANYVDPSERDEKGNYAESEFIGIDTHNINVFGHNKGKLVATIGLDNITIVTTEDVILIMQNGRGQEVKNVVEEIKKRKLDHLL